VLTYTLLVSNGGPSDAAGVILSDTLPAGETFVSQSSPDASFVILGNTGNVLSDGFASLPVNGAVVVVVTATVNANTGGVMLHNTATVSVGSATDPNTNNNKSSADTTVNGVDLALSMDDGVTAAFLGQTLTYTLSYSNTGFADATGVALEEQLPPGATFQGGNVNWVAQGGGFYKASVGSVAINGSGTATFVLTVNNPPTQTSIVNTASISDDGTHGVDVNTANNTASDTDSIAMDFGGAPAPYPTLLADNGARHYVVLNGLRLGPSVTAETDGQPNTTATGDTGDDGVTFLSPFVGGGTAAIKVNVQTRPVPAPSWTLGSTGTTTAHGMMRAKRSRSTRRCSTATKRSPSPCPRRRK
jgi:uncharacterized repeat protein (TIGR01451 family)